MEFGVTNQIDIDPLILRHEETPLDAAIHQQQCSRNKVKAYYIDILSREEFNMGLQLPSDIHKEMELLRVVEFPCASKEPEQTNPSPTKGKCNERKPEMAD